MRICLHTVWPIRSNFIGGTERFIIDAAKSLQRYGFETFVVCSNAERRASIEGVSVFGSIPEPFRARIFEYGNNLFKSLQQEFYTGAEFIRSARRLSEYVSYQLASFEFDFVHLNTFSASLYGFSELPAAVTVHENPDELDAFWGSGSFAALASAIRTRSASPPGLIAAPTEFYASTYAEQFDRPVRAVPLGLPWRNVSGPPRKLPRPTARPRLIVPARIALRQKGQDLAVTAVDRLHREGVEVELVLTGASDENREGVEVLRRMIDEVARPDLFFLKRVPDMGKEIAAADVALSPERYCSFGISVRECLAAGLPLVLSDIPPHRELEAAPQAVYFFPVDNVGDCAAAIAQALEGASVTPREAIRFRMRNDFDAAMRVYGYEYLSSPEKRGIV